jgi:hypothetical protein
MKAVGQTLTWAELGDSFVQHVFTPERVAPMLAQALPKQVRLGLPIPGGEAEVTVDVHEPRVLRPLPDVLRVDLPLRIDIDGEVLGMIEADARLHVVVSMFMKIEPRWPLVVFLNARPVQPEEVAISKDAASTLFQLADGLGQLPDLRAMIADAINAEVEKTLPSRTIDVLAQIDGATLGAAPAVAEPLPGSPVEADHVPSEGWTYIEPAAIAAVLEPR